MIPAARKALLEEVENLVAASYQHRVILLSRWVRLIHVGTGAAVNWKVTMLVLLRSLSHCLPRNSFLMERLGQARLNQH